MAGARSAWTPMSSTAGFTLFATRPQPQAPLPPPIGTRITSTSGSSSTISKA